MRIGRPPRGTRWLAGALGLGVAVTAVIVAGPAGAATTVPAQLALSGVVTSKSPTGGSVVGIHPGDAVDFKAAPAGVSTQGLNNLGIPLGDLLGGLLGQVVGYQVVMHLPASFPGGARDVKLGPCGGASDLKVTFPAKGTYNLTWSAYSVTVAPLLGTCSLNTLNLDGNQLKQAGIALNASNQWIGKVVVATDPPAGGISVQLPGVGVHPSVPVVGQLPSASLPGGSVPTLPVSGPSANPPVNPPPSSTPTGGLAGSGRGRPLHATGHLGRGEDRAQGLRLLRPGRPPGGRRREQQADRPARPCAESGAVQQRPGVRRRREPGRDGRQPGTDP